MSRGPKAPPRFSLHPIEHFLAGIVGHPLTAREIAVHCGYPSTRSGRARIQRYRDDGIPLDAADKIATRLGFHPVELWPAFLDDLDDQRPTAAYSFYLTCPYDGRPVRPFTTEVTTGWSTRAAAICSHCGLELLITVELAPLPLTLEDVG
jgi:hypothetical protein